MQRYHEKTHCNRWEKDPMERREIRDGVRLVWSAATVALDFLDPTKTIVEALKRKKWISNKNHADPEIPCNAPICTPSNAMLVQWILFEIS